MKRILLLALISTSFSVFADDAASSDPQPAAVDATASQDNLAINAFGKDVDQIANEMQQSSDASSAVNSSGQ